METFFPQPVSSKRMVSMKRPHLNWRLKSPERKTVNQEILAPQVQTSGLVFSISAVYEDEGDYAKAGDDEQTPAATTAGVIRVHRRSHFFRHTKPTGGRRLVLRSRCISELPCCSAMEQAIRRR